PYYSYCIILYSSLSSHRVLNSFPTRRSSDLEESILNGFRNVILMGDHGGGQPQVYEEVAKKLDRRYRPNGIRVFYCDQVYRAAKDRKSTRLNSSHQIISYAVFCLKKKKREDN